MSLNSESQIDGYFRLAIVLFVLVITIANSALFYFIIWDIFDPKDPYINILFFLSASAQLTYVFFPWFAKDLLRPVVKEQSSEGDHLQRGASKITLFAKSFVQVGVVMSLSSILFWAIIHEDAPSYEMAPLNVLITEDNCKKIGGKMKRVAGKLRCDTGTTEIQGKNAPSTSEPSN